MHSHWWPMHQVCHMWPASILSDEPQPHDIEGLTVTPELVDWLPLNCSPYDVPREVDLQIIASSFNWTDPHKMDNGLKIYQSGGWDEHVHTTIYKIGNPQGPTAELRQLTQYSVITTWEKNTEKKDICICITEPFCCTPETNTTL